MAEEFDKEKAVSHWEECQSTYDNLYEESKADWKFLHGVDQWDEYAKKARDKDHRPCLTLNQMLPYAMQVVNDIRQARLAIRVSPVDEAADIDTAEIFQGIIRNIERQSAADKAYTSASLNAIGAGIGWMRVRTDYADADSFDQEIFIDRVLDFTSVYLDPQSQELDGSDAEYGFIRVDYSKEQFEILYPDADPVSWDSTSNDDEVCIVEYFCKYYKESKIYKIQLVDGSEQVITQDQKDILDDDGTVEYVEIESRDTQYPYVKHYVLNGSDEPIKETEFPSKYIPLIPVIGEEVYINGRREFHSIIRQGKDAQRMYNYYNSMETELNALQPKAPIVGAVGSFKTDVERWETANAANYPFLEYDVVHDKQGQRVEPPRRMEPYQGNPALFQGAMRAKEDIRLAIGLPQANMGQQGNEVSGVAIRNRQIEGDNATFHFIDNLSVSISFLGKILVDMIPRLYSQRKITRILGEDGEERNVPVNTPFVKEGGIERPMKPNESKYDGIYQLGVGKYDVVCDVGASYSSKRQETADKLIEVVQAQPELMAVVGDLIFEALDLPMGKEIADRLKSQMPPELLGEDPMAEKLKAADMAMQQLQDQLMTYQAALDNKKKDTQFEQHVELKKLDIENRKLAIDAQKTAAEIEKMRAETSNFDMESVQALGGAVQGLFAEFNDVKEAMEIMLSAKELEEAELVTGEPQSPVSETLEGNANV
jgi:hypothetical protein